MLQLGRETLGSTMFSKHDEQVYHLGHDLLGPIVHRWLLGLHQYMNYLDDGSTAFLYCARAGVRIQRLYRTFLDGFAPSHTDKGAIFWVSRMSISKGTYLRSPDRSKAAISREYLHEPIRNLVVGVFRHHPDIIQQLDLDRDEHKAHGHVFSGWLNGPTRAAGVMRTYFQECSAAFDNYLRGLIGENSRVVLIDSGWQGSSQSLLGAAYPELSWKGLYFGRILTPNHDKSIADDVIGIIFEADTYNPARPETAFVRHRHIIETILEPNGPSVEEVPSGKFEAVARQLIEKNINASVDPVKDPLFLAIEEYLSGSARGLSITEIMARYQPAIEELARVIVAPTKVEAKALICKDRSADFGKALCVPVLIDPEAPDAKTLIPDERIAKSLWTEGQIALEYDGGFALDLQMRASGALDARSYFDPHSVKGAAHTLQAIEPSVAIITRTKNRPVLLRRAADSVAKQTFKNYIWVIVNDGGDVDSVRDVIEKSLVDRRRIILVNNPRSLGMEAASNAGIRSSKSDFIVIHDDDDSWAPDFLRKTVDYLNSERGAHYGGVISHSTYISETIVGNQVIEHDRRPYMDWVRNVQLAEMAAGNLFAPISFLFRRSHWETIGGYNEALPVLGDWFFNLEMLLRTDIGVIAEPLANYHHRDRGDNSAYSNSVVGGISKHEEYAAVARNEFIRRNAAKYPGAISAIFGYFAGDIRRGNGNNSANSPNVVEKVIVSTDYDLLDKYWVIAHINRELADIRTRVLTRISPMNAVEPWEAVETVVASKRLKIPIPPDFDEAAYLRSYPDVATSVQSGKLTSGYQHYVMHGRKEGRHRSTITAVSQ